MDSLPKRLEQLEDALAALPPDRDAMTLGELDGFIAGILICPAPIAPEEWLPLLWREPEAEVAPAAAGAPDTESLTAQIMEHYRLTSLELRASEDGYRPIYYVDDATGAPVWEGWAAGFGEAMQVRMESWASVMEADDEEARLALTGLMELVAVATMPQAEGSTLPEREELARDAPDLIPLWVETLFDWRLDYRPDPVQTPVRSVKIGRNEPCPCGSGKKHKKCCGAA